MDNTIAAQVYRQARETYIAEHPPPDVLDLWCSRCGARPGVPCTWGRGYSSRHGQHIARQSAHAREYNRAQRAATDHAWEAENAAWRAHRTQPWTA